MGLSRRARRKAQEEQHVSAILPIALRCISGPQQDECGDQKIVMRVASGLAERLFPKA